MATTATRIYRVAVGEAVRLVRAAHPSHAVQHVARDLVDVRIATHDDLEALLPKGTKVETLKAEQRELPTT
jgi:hypothetical protein